MKYCFSAKVAARGALLATALTAVVATPALASPGPQASPSPPPLPPSAAAAPARPAAPVSASTLQSLATTALSALSASGSSTDTSGCTDPAVSQAFASWGDSNSYALAPGETADSFNGTGWTLSGGASITTNQLYDEQTGPVLDLPSGSIAISPPMCVDSDYPTARTMIQTSGGAQVAAGVFYASNPPKNQLQLSGVLQGTGTGFSPSQPFQVYPGSRSGWQMVQFVFGSTGTGGDGQIYNFYVDPRMCH